MSLTSAEKGFCLSGVFSLGYLTMIAQHTKPPHACSRMHTHSPLSVTRKGAARRRSHHYDNLPLPVMRLDSLSASVTHKYSPLPRINHSLPGAHPSKETIGSADFALVLETHFVHLRTVWFGPSILVGKRALPAPSLSLRHVARRRSLVSWQPQRRTCAWPSKRGATTTHALSL